VASQRTTAGGGLKQRIEVLERDNRRLSEAKDVLKRYVGEIANSCPKVKKELTDVKWELEKLKGKSEPLPPQTSLFSCPGAEVIGQPTKRSSPAAETRPLEASAEFNSLKTSDLLHRLRPSPTESSCLLLRLPMTLSIRFASTAKICQAPQNRDDALTAVLKNFYGHSAPMSASSSWSSPRRAKAVRQWAVISGDESKPIPCCALLLACKSRRYIEELVLSSGPGDIVIDSAFDRDSVLQFISACDGAEFSLTLSNVFEIKLLCDEWSVSGMSIRQKVIEFIEHLPSGESLWLRRLLFRLGRGLSTSETEDLLRCNLVSLVCDPAALDIPAAILSRIIDFRSYEGRR
jgi:hypothetical protein